MYRHVMRMGGNRRPRQRIYRSSQGRKRRISEMKWDREVVRVMKQKNLTRKEVVTRQNIAEGDGEPVTVSKSCRQFLLRDGRSGILQSTHVGRQGNGPKSKHTKANVSNFPLLRFKRYKYLKKNVFSHTLCVKRDFHSRDYVSYVA